MKACVFAFQAWLPLTKFHNVAWLAAIELFMVG